MLPLRLNLLSPEKRTSIERLVYVQFIRNSIELVVFVLSILGIMLLGGDWVLQNRLNELSADLTLVSNQQAKKNNQIQTINATILRTDTLQKEYILWSRIIVPIIAVIPHEINLQQLSMNMRDKTMMLVGTAQTRNSLLALQNELKKLPLVATVTLPLSQLANKENLSFSISVSLK